MLKATFFELLSKYTDDNRLVFRLWKEIETKYSDHKRHYHTLSHLENLLYQLSEIKTEIKHWETALFSLYYHDAIYDSSKANNEEESAKLAQKRMAQVGVPKEVVDKCLAQILATKKHHESNDSDTNFFTDSDLSILGQTEVYSEYSKNIRKEYSIYEDLVYNAGRIIVLKHFLSMQRIFKTDYFYQKFEVRAKQNLQKELEMLQ